MKEHCVSCRNELEMSEDRFDRDGNYCRQCNGRAWGKTHGMRNPLLLDDVII